jgi:hypothetical protein
MAIYHNGKRISEFYYVEQNGIVPTGTKVITTNGTHDVTTYENVAVNVEGTVPTETKNITSNGTYDVIDYAKVVVNVPAGITPTGTYEITKLGTFDVTKYANVQVIDSDLVASNVKVGVNILGVTGTFSGDVEQETKSVALSMDSGDQVVKPTSGKLLNQVTVKKPSTLLPENIIHGIDIGGVIGTYTGDIESEVKSVNLSLSTGYQNVFPTSGKLLSKVIINKPDTLIAANIKSGVEIAGIAGTYEGEKPATQSKTVTPSTEEQVIEADSGYYLENVTVTGVDSNIDSNIIPENIRSGVTILGIEGSMECINSVSTLPEANASNLNKIVSYDGKLYICVEE